MQFTSAPEKNLTEDEDSKIYWVEWVKEAVFPHALYPPETIF